MSSLRGSPRRSVTFPQVAELSWVPSPRPPNVTRQLEGSSLPNLRLECCAVLVLALVTACQAPEQLVCSPVGPAVVATVFDSVTNAAAATGARGVSELAGDIDSLVVVAPERMISHHYATPGTYSVRVEKAGYQPWSATLVAMPGGRCGSSGISVDVRLKPATQP